MNQTKTESFYVYQLKDGTFYKGGKRGSFSLAANPYTRKELTTKQMALAERFAQLQPHVLESNMSPYDTSFMMGGKWVKVTATTNYVIGYIK